MLKSLDSLGELKGKTLLALTNFDVRADAKTVLPGAEWRVNASIPFLKELSDVGAKTVLLSHRGQPHGKKDENLSLKPVFNYLKETFGEKIFFVSSTIGQEATEAIEKIKDGEILILENVRFNVGEEENDKDFTKQLSSLGDAYINNDFATSHRSHASVVGLSKLLPSAAGPLVEREVAELSPLQDLRGSELTLIIGGAKTKTKLSVVSDFLSKKNNVLVGGVMANTLLSAKRLNIGLSLTDKNKEDFSKINLGDENLFLPTDVVVSKSINKAEQKETKKVNEVSNDEYIVDIGPETREQYIKKIMAAKVIVWGGPLGVVEIPDFKGGSLAVAKAFAESDGRSIAGGGDIVSFLAGENVLRDVDHISTGGGAMLAYLAGDKLPGLEALEKNV